MNTKTERFEARLSSEQKELFVEAATLEGVSLSEFIIQSAYQAAKRAIQEKEILVLTARDRKAFVQSLLEDSAPSPRLKRAAKRYLETKGSTGTNC